MLRMITYGDLPNGDPGMNTLLISAEIPPERCVSKYVAIYNGTDTDKMNEFATANGGVDKFPNTRLVPVWPIEESGYSKMCTYPCDSSRMRVGRQQNQPDNPTGDSYLAGYDYTFENVPDWLTITRRSTTTFHTNAGYVWDQGIEITAQALADGEPDRYVYVTVIAKQNSETMAAARIYAQQNNAQVCETVCEKTKILIYQKAQGGTGKQFVGVDKLTLTATSSTVENNTRINLAAICTEQNLSGTCFANGTTLGQSAGEYSSLARVSGTGVEVNIAQIRSKFDPFHTANVTFLVYGTWEGAGSTSRKIPVPIRNSYRVDVSANKEIVESMRMISCGNMNILENDIDSKNPDISQRSTITQKVAARCALVATIGYNLTTDTVTVTLGDDTVDGGICPIFYPTTYSINGTSGQFTWLGSGSSTSRLFQPINMSASEITVNVESTNLGSNTAFNVSVGENSALDSYTVNGTTITTSQGVDISSGSFTIDLSSCAADTTHRFRLRQIIPDADINSGNSSPEYADIAFTIVNQ